MTELLAGISLEKLAEMAPDMRICNCVACKKLLLAHYEGPPIYRVVANKTTRWDPPKVAGRIKGAPHCDACLELDTETVSGIGGGLAGPRDVSGEWGSWDNAVRRHED